jgi:hypothetical protein
MDVKIHIFLTSALAGDEWSASRPCRFTPSTRWIGGWVDPRAGLDHVGKRKFLTLPGLEPRLLSRPARSQSLYRLRYPGYQQMKDNTKYSRPVNRVNAVCEVPETVPASIIRDTCKECCICRRRTVLRKNGRIVREGAIMGEERHFIEPYFGRSLPGFARSSF